MFGTSYTMPRTSMVSLSSRPSSQVVRTLIQGLVFMLVHTTLTILSQISLIRSLRLTMVMQRMLSMLVTWITKS
jgi:hypothetical protein